MITVQLLTADIVYWYRDCVSDLEFKLSNFCVISEWRIGFLTEIVVVWFVVQSWD